MDDLKRIEAHGDAGRVVTGKKGGEEYDRGRGEKNRDGPVETNGPTKRLFVDDENQNERKKKTEHDPGKIGEQAKKTGFSEDQLAKLRAGGAKIAKQTEFATAIDDESEESAGNAHNGYENSDGFERVGDGKSAVK